MEGFNSVVKKSWYKEKVPVFEEFVLNFYSFVPHCSLAPEASTCTWPENVSEDSPVSEGYVSHFSMARFVKTKLAHTDLPPVVKQETES